MLLPSGDYESHDKQEETSTKPDETTKYLEVGELLITRRVLSVMVNPKEAQERIFLHSLHHQQ